jgi:ketosteroid isomerase-like protein
LLACLFAAAPALCEEQADPALEVRKAEIAFARSMADRDLQAFLEFVAEDAIFFGSAGALRGAEAVKAAWEPFFRTPQAPFSWEPEHVEVLDSGDLAFSSGPVRDAQGNRIGTFNSVWRRNAKGRWEVVFDKGCPPCAAP